MFARLGLASVTRLSLTRPVVLLLAVTRVLEAVQSGLSAASPTAGRRSLRAPRRSRGFADDQRVGQHAFGELAGHRAAPTAKVRDDQLERRFGHCGNRLL